MHYIKRNKYKKLANLLKNHDIHPDSCLNHNKQTGLHLSAKYGMADCLGVYLTLKASHNRVDHKGNLPLHYAVKYCLKNHSPGNVRDLVSVLLGSQDLDLPNHKGTTCRKLIQGLNKLNDDENSSSYDSEVSIKDDSFEQKLQDVKDQEYFETTGKFEQQELFHNEYHETFDEWADRIFKEFQSKRQSVTPKLNKKPPPESEPKKQLVLKPVVDKKLQVYEDKCRKIFHDKDGCEIRPKDLPFGMHTMPDEIVRLIIGSSKLEGQIKLLLREALRKWHPDKFAQTFNNRIHNKQDQLEILQIVTHVSQALLNYGKK